MSQTKAQLISDLVQALNFTGTSSAPANGMYLSAANTISLSTNSTAGRLTISSTGEATFGGNVTVTSPAHDGGLSVLAGNNNQETRIRIQGKASGGASHDWYLASSRGSDTFTIHNGTTSWLSITDAGVSTFAGSLTVDTNTFHVNAPDNRVGIGTASPTSILHIESTSPSVKFVDTDASGGFGMVGVNNTSGSLVMRSDDGNSLANSYMGFEIDGGTKMYIKSNGNVGIGTTSPGNNLHVKGSGTDVLKVESTDAGAQGTNLILQHSPGAGNMADNDVISLLQFAGVDDSNNATTYSSIRAVATDVSNNNESGDITFHTRNAGTFDERVRIQYDGKIGIGTTSPSTKLSLEGSAGSTSHGILIGAKNAGGIRGVIEVHTAADTTGFNLSRTGGGSDTDIVLLKNDSDIGVVECRNSSNATKIRLKAGALSYLHSEDSRGHQELLELKHTNTTTTGDGPALLFNGYYSSAEWKYAKISAENSGSGYGAKFKIHVHPSNGTQGANLVQALNIVGDGTGADVTIVDGNLKIGTAGHGIDFSAQTTSSASGAAPSTSSGDETLDHYEKGTWTLFDASGASLTLSNAHRWYIRIGDLVHVNFYISYPTNTDSTLSKLGGLPFAAKANNYFYLNGRVAGQSNGVMFQVNAGDTVIEPYVNDARRTNAQLSGCYMLISGCYQI